MKNHSLKMFIILIAAAVVLIAGVAVTVYLVTRDGGDQKEYLPMDYGNDPSGLDDEYSQRY